MNQPYESYKPSGIDWLGDIPSYWGITNLKNCADFTNGAAFKPEDWQHEGIPIVRIQNLNGSEEFNYINPDKVVSEKAHLYGGELLFSWSGNVGTSFGPFIWRDNTEAYLNQHIFKVENLNLDKSYFYWLLRAVTKYIETKTHGIIGMVHITKPELGNIPVPKINYAEQRAIATYLDRKTAQIDDLVARKEKLLALLQQKRQAIINEAVTRGLDANAPKKDSGIEWLGEIPAHWEVKKLKWVTKRITDGAHISPDTSSPDYPFVSTIDIKQGKIDFDNCLRTTEGSYKYLVKTGCKPVFGDILFSKDGTIGRTAIIDFDKEFVVASSLIIISPDPEMVDCQFLELALQSLPTVNQVEALLSGSALRRISISKLTNLGLAIPPLSEQKAIFVEASKRIDKIQKIEKDIKNQLAYFKTYRQSLISEVVTGKVDVRSKVMVNEQV